MIRPLVKVTGQFVIGESVTKTATLSDTMLFWPNDDQAERGRSEC